MAEGWMDRRDWDRKVEEDRIRMSRELFGRDYILPDIPGDVVGATEWTQPGRNPHGFSGYPVWDRRAAVEQRANQIMMENPGIASPEAAVAMAEKEVPQHSRSEQRILAMESYFRQQGMEPGAAKERAIMEEEDAWRRRGHQAAAQSQPAQRPQPQPRQPSQWPSVRTKPESRTDGASLPLPADGEVKFGSTAQSGPRPMSLEGLDQSAVQATAAQLESQGIPADEAWGRAQLIVSRGGGTKPTPQPASAGRARPAGGSGMWQGYTAFEGADINEVQRIATHLVRSRGMQPKDAWAKAQVEVSRGTREGGTVSNAEIDSRLRGGAGNERRSPDYTVPGPNDPTGVPTSVSRKMTPEEQYAYNERPQSHDGTYHYSKRDEDMIRRGYVPVQTPEGVRYMVNADTSFQAQGVVGRPGVPGVRKDLEERGYVPFGGYRDVRGEPVTVYEVTPETAEHKNRTRTPGFAGHKGGTPSSINAQIKYLADQAGISVEEARKMVDDHIARSTADDDKSNDIVLGSRESFQPLRDRAASNRTQDRLARVQETRRQAMLAGGQPTGGPGGTRAWAAGLGMLPQDWQNQVMANQLSGGDIGGATPLDVQGQQIRNGNRLLTADALAGNTEAAAAMRTLEMNEAARRQARQDTLRKKAAEAWHGAWRGASRSGKAREALEREGATPQEIDEILADLGAGDIPSAPAGQSDAPASPIPGLDPEAVRPQPWPSLPPPAPVPQLPWSPGRMPNW